MKRLFVAWLMVTVMGLNFAVVEAAQAEIQPATMSNFVQSFNRLLGNSMSTFSFRQKVDSMGGVELYSCMLVDKKTLGQVQVSAVANKEGYLQMISIDMVDAKTFNNKNASLVPLFTVQACGNEVIDLQDALSLTAIIRDNWTNKGNLTIEPLHAAWGGPSGKVYQLAFSNNIHIDAVSLGIML